jgi:hypothetical protein
MTDGGAEAGRTEQEEKNYSRSSILASNHKSPLGFIFQRLPE